MWRKTCIHATHGSLWHTHSWGMPRLLFRPPLSLCPHEEESVSQFIFFLTLPYGFSMRPFRENLPSHDWNISSWWTRTLGLLRCAPPPYLFHCSYFIFTSDPETSDPICIRYQLAASRECEKHAHKDSLSMKQPGFFLCNSCSFQNKLDTTTWHFKYGRKASEPSKENTENAPVI